MSLVVAGPTTAAAEMPRPGRYDRVFYGSIAVAAAAVTFAGFAPTFYLRLFDGGPTATVTGAPFTALVSLHGAVFTAWVALFILQTALISARRVKVHRQLGVVGAVLAGVMVVVGTLTGIAMARRGSAPPGIPPLSFLAIPIFDMITFGGFVAAALLRRRDRESHKRLMLLAYASILAAPMARLPGVLPFGPLAFYGLAFVVIIAGVIYDFASRGRVHKVYLVGGTLLAISVPLRLMLSTTTAWLSFARLLTR